LLLRIIQQGSSPTKFSNFEATEKAACLRKRP
jgi:hypothetical protein